MQSFASLIISHRVPHYFFAKRVSHLAITSQMKKNKLTALSVILKVKNMRPLAIAENANIRLGCYVASDW